MTDQSIVSGNKILGSGRAPGRFQTGRVCTESGCRTLLSKYNRHDTCFQHSPIRFPRVRGRIQRDIASRESQ